MSLRPSTIAAADYNAVNRTLLGGEFEVWLTRDEIIDLGNFAITGANAGMFTADSVGAAQLAAYPMELVAMAKDELNGGSNAVQLVLLGTDDSDNPVSGVAAIDNSSFHKNTDKYWPRGMSAQFDTNDSLVKAITSLNIVCDADAAGSSVQIFGIPPISRFKQVSCAQVDDFTSKAREFVAIQCGMDEAAETKPGLLKQPSLSVTAKIKNFADGFARYNGGRTSVLLKPNKEGLYVPEYIFLKSWGGRLEGRSGEGETNTTGTMSGPFEEMIYLPAL